jgi:hypothetical protein
MTTGIKTQNKAEIGRVLRLLHAPGTVFEIRILDAPIRGTYRATVAGYFDDPDKAAAALIDYDGQANIYTTLNPCDPALLARAANRLIQVGKKNPLTADKDILQRRWLPLDLDYQRPANISASADELTAALALADEIETYLAGLGWPAPIQAMSGNGAHRVYGIDLPNSDDTSSLLKAVLTALAARWPGAVKVDETVFNAARIWKLYGTMAVKGDNIPGRPHRRAELISMPETIELVTADMLRAIAPAAKPVTVSLPTRNPAASNGTTASNGTGFYTAEKIEAAMAEQHIGFTRKETNGRSIYILDRCLTSADHTDGACISFDNGKPGYKCQHDSCNGRNWQAVKPILFPDGTRGSGATDADGRPRIQTNARHHRDISADAYAALLQANTPPAVFVRGGQLTRIVTDESDRPAAGQVDADSLKYILDRAASFYSLSYNRRDESYSQTDGTVQIGVVKDILSYPAWPDLPPLVGIVTAPTFAPDGTLVTEAGYNPATRLYYHKNGLKIGDVTPTADNVTAAKNLILHNLLIDFPFADQASAAHAVALLLLPFVRSIIDGPTPLHLTDAPTIGTGKGLLNLVATLPFSPDGPDLMTAPADPDEWRKRITSSLMKAPSHILIDNIAGRLDSADLAAVITAPFWTDRILGKSENITLPVRAIWMGTANNIALSPELTRRAIWIRLDAETEKPWERSGFIHGNLIEWGKANRGELVTSALTLVNKWIADGRPDGPATLGSFERWAKTMGGILDSAGIDGFMSNVTDMYDRLNTGRAPWVAFIEAWWEAHGQRLVGAAELFPIASEYEPAAGETGLNLLADELGDGNERARKTNLGRLLQRNESRVFGHYKIVAGKKRQRLAQYRLVDINEPTQIEMCT